MSVVSGLWSCSSTWCVGTTSVEGCYSGFLSSRCVQVWYVMMTLYCSAKGVSWLYQWMSFFWLVLAFFGREEGKTGTAIHDNPPWCVGRAHLPLPWAYVMRTGSLVSYLMKVVCSHLMSLLWGRCQQCFQGMRLAIPQVHNLAISKVSLMYII
jgi:hypothetical protein